MIEFNGYLTGAAEKYFYRKSQILGRNILLITMIVVFPLFWMISKWSRSIEILWAYGILFACIPLFCRIPKRRKTRIDWTPKKIFIDEDYIVSVASAYTESKLIDDVKLVRDFGDFYEIVFPFGKVSEKFICQKDLLGKGTIEEFEALFEGKLERKTHF